MASMCLAFRCAAPISQSLDKWVNRAATTKPGGYPIGEYVTSILSRVVPPITKQVWFTLQDGAGEVVIVYFESANPAQSRQSFQNLVGGVEGWCMAQVAPATPVPVQCWTII